MLGGLHGGDTDRLWLLDCWRSPPASNRKLVSHLSISATHPSPSFPPFLLHYRWQLTSLELNLLLLFHSSLPPAQCHDVPIFLPSASPNLAHRLLIFSLTADIELVVLCDAEPSLSLAQQLVYRFWSVVADNVRELAQTHRLSLASGLSLDPAILGFCLVNLERRRCVSYLLPAEEHRDKVALLSAGVWVWPWMGGNKWKSVFSPPGYQGVVGEGKRRSYLRQFYRAVAGNLLPMRMSLSSTQVDEDHPGTASHPHTHHRTLSLLSSPWLAELQQQLGSALTDRIPHKIQETYMCAQVGRVLATPTRYWAISSRLTAVPDTPNSTSKLTPSTETSITCLSCMM